MLDIRKEKPEPGDMVLLKELPPGFIDNLPKADQRAVTAIVGQPILLLEYDDAGRAELQFTDSEEVIRFIYVDPTFITKV